MNESLPLPSVVAETPSQFSSNSRPRCPQTRSLRTASTCRWRQMTQPTAMSVNAKFMDSGNLSVVLNDELASLCWPLFKFYVPAIMRFTSSVDRKKASASAFVSIRTKRFSCSAADISQSQFVLRLAKTKNAGYASKRSGQCTSVIHFTHNTLRPV